jgi:ribosomal protein L17
MSNIPNHWIDSDQKDNLDTTPSTFERLMPAKASKTFETMKLHEPEVSQDKLYAKIAASLSQPSTAIFADTSILFWLYSLGHAARQEFITWAGGTVKGRFKIPVWAAHELHKHMADNPARLTVLDAEIKSVDAKMRELRRLVSLFADEAKRQGLLDRREYVGRLDKAAQEFIKLCKAAGSQQPWQQLSKEIVPFINENVLASDIFPALRWVEGDYATRSAGKVPPGFKDEKKQENKFGDLMLWNEVVSHCSANFKISTVVLLTDDNKPDWVFRPTSVLDSGGSPHKNEKRDGFETLLAPPLLTHELGVGSNVRNFYIINTTTLAIILERYANLNIPGLFAAVQPVIPVPRPSKNGAGSAQVSIPATENVPAGEFPEDLALPQRLTLGLEDLLSGLRSLDAVEQEEALRRLELTTLSFTTPEFVTLGKAISQATRTELQNASNFINRFDDTTANLKAPERLALFEGLLHDLYFDSANAPRPLPLDGDVEAIFGAADRASLAPVLEKFQATIMPYRDHYLAIPTSPSQKISLTFSLGPSRWAEPRELNQVNFGTADLMEDLPPGADDLIGNYLGSPAGPCTISDLVSAIARRFSVPLDWLEADQPPETQVTWVETKGFRQL